MPLKDGFALIYTHILRNTRNGNGIFQGSIQLIPVQGDRECDPHGLQLITGRPVHAAAISTGVDRLP